MADSSLFHAAARASQQPFFLGSALASYAKAEGLDDPNLATRLGCEPADLALIRLCRRPNGGSVTFASDVLLIAERFSLDAANLAEILRQVEALDALQSIEVQRSSLLAAARDRDDADPAT